MQRPVEVSDPKPHSCRYETLDGEPVAPVVLRQDLLERMPDIAIWLATHSAMRPGTLYRCRRCQGYVFVTPELQILRLVARPNL